MKIALVAPPSGIFQDILSTPGEFEPIGLEFIASALRKEGFSQNIYAKLPADPTQAADYLFDQMMLERHDLVGITAVTAQIPWVIKLIQSLKSLGIKIPFCLGGERLCGLCGSSAQSLAEGATNELTS